MTNRATMSLIISQTSIRELVAVARLLEQGGYERVWLGEAWREPIVPATAITLGTRRIGVGTAIAQMFPVNPVVTAQQAAQLQELSDGRFALGLGLGAGFVVERWFGVDYERPVRRAREFIEIVRGVLASPERGPFSYDGELLRTRKYTLSFAQSAVDVPIHLAAVGPQMQRLAGELADGVIVGALHSESFMEETLANLAAGAQRSGRDPTELEVYYYLTCCVSRDGDRARALARRSLVYLAQYPHYLAVYEREGFGTVAQRMATLVRERRMDEAEAAVLDAMLERFCIAGTPAQCKAQLHRFARYPGVPVLHLVPFRIEETEVLESIRLASQLLVPAPALS